MDTLDLIGMQPALDAKRDAVHFAVIPMVASEDLRAGLRVQYIAGRDDCLAEWSDHMKRMASAINLPGSNGDLEVKDSIWRAIQSMRQAIERANRLQYGSNMLNSMEEAKTRLHHIIKELS